MNDYVASSCYNAWQKPGEDVSFNLLFMFCFHFQQFVPFIF